MEQVFENTRNAIEGIIAKPKCSDKLLGKPPFRFLHDVISNVMKATDYANGLYTDEEMDSSTIKDKADKMNYLQKMINCVGYTVNEDLEARPSKIVSGLEPEHTNTFLQALAKASQVSDYEQAVEKALADTGGSRASSAASRTQSRGSDQGAKEAEQEEQSRLEEERLRKEEKAKRAKEKAKREEEAQRAREEERANQEARQAAEDEERANEEKKQAAEDEEGEPVSIPSFERPPSRQATGRQDTMAEQKAEKVSCDGSIECTKELMEAIISKPKMASKLLNKPPFRFLHDVVMEVIRATGFANGLYDDDESDSANIKDKASKIQFLSKMISCTSFHCGVDLEARAVKIVSGLEAEYTNKWLQHFAVAASSGDDGHAAVQRVLAGETSERPPSTASNSSKPSTPAEAKAVEKPAAQPKTVVESKPAKAAPMQQDDDDDDNAKLVMPALSIGQNNDNDDDDDDAAQPKRTSRPTTARRRPPKLRENARNVTQNVAVVDAPHGIMQDGDNEHSDDDDEDRQEKVQDMTMDGGLDANEHGKLVRDILNDQSKAADSDGKSNNNEESKSEDAKKNTGIRLGKRRKSQNEGLTCAGFSSSDVVFLRASIQQLCQATNPLGKCLEYVFEDMESMNRELETWRDEYVQKCEIYEEERKRTDDELQPFRVQMIDVDEKTLDQIQKINSIKSSIAKNDTRIQQLLKLVVS